MSEQAKQTAENLNSLLEKMNDSGMERLLDYGSGYIRGFQDANAQTTDTHPTDAP